MSQFITILRGGNMLTNCSLLQPLVKLRLAHFKLSATRRTSSKGSHFHFFPLKSKSVCDLLPLQTALSDVLYGIKKWKKYADDEEDGFCRRSSKQVLVQDDSKLQAPLRNFGNGTNKDPQNELSSGLAPFTAVGSEEQQLQSVSRAVKVPGSRLVRFLNFGHLAAGLGVGAALELGKQQLNRIVDRPSDVLESNPFLSAANSERIVSTLCRVRGAALKLGQMLSIQDNSLISPTVQLLFERVRNSADFMPTWQLEKVLQSSFGLSWQRHFREFETKPFAAASIGQVHRAVLVDGRHVAVKIQYPGVAKSINSDIDNLLAILKLTSLLPKGLFLDTFATSMRTELAAECDYLQEAHSLIRFKALLEEDSDFYVPDVIEELSTQQILTTLYAPGVPLDQTIHTAAGLRNWIGYKVLELCLREVFEFQFMQSDPNWSNFLFNAKDGRLVLLDFGASREYSDQFVNNYFQIIRAAVSEDRATVLKVSQQIGFLTGFESKAMEDAHCDAVLILAEPFRKRTAFDFAQQNTTQRIEALIPRMLSGRLKPPPPEIYSLHRKLSGAFLLCAKLQCSLHCKPLFERVCSKFEASRKI